MTITISPRTEAMLREQADRLGQDADSLADALLQDALSDTDRDFDETCEAIAEGLADVEAGRTVPFEIARREWDAVKAARSSAA